MPAPLHLRTKFSSLVSDAVVTPWVISLVCVSRWSRLRVSHCSRSTLKRKRSRGRRLLYIYELRVVLSLVHRTLKGWSALRCLNDRASLMGYEEDTWKSTDGWSGYCCAANGIMFKIKSLGEGEITWIRIHMNHKIFLPKVEKKMNLTHFRDITIPVCWV